MIANFQADQLLVRVYPDRTAMGAAAAELVIARIGMLLQQKSTVNIIFAAAPSQNEFLAALREAPVDWTRVNAFHMDEYVGLPADAPQGFGNFLRRALFGHLHFANVFYIDGNNSNLAGECQRYSELLRTMPPDIVCMGIGENGHLAFNDPPVADFHDPYLVKSVLLDQACRQQQVNDGCFAWLEEVPQRAITLTIPALMQAPFICCVVPGPTKARAVYNTLQQPILAGFPSTILRTHRNAVLLLDQQAAEQIALQTS